MNHGYNITVDGEKVTLKDLSFTLPNDNPDVDYYTNGKVKFSPGATVSLQDVKDKTEIVSVMKSVEPITEPSTTEPSTAYNPTTTTTTAATTTSSAVTTTTTTAISATTTTTSQATSAVTSTTTSTASTAPQTTDIPTTTGIEIIYGDANGDKKVTAADVLLIRKKIAGQNVTINTKASDVNCDDKLTASDVLMIRKFIAGQHITLGQPGKN